MSFDTINFHSADWNKIKEYLEDQKAIAINVLCSDLDPVETNKQRGKLIFIQQMLNRAERIQKQASENTGR